jgi:hypothetical protein
VKNIEGHKDQEKKEVGKAERFFCVEVDDKSYDQCGKTDNGQKIIKNARTFAAEIKGRCNYGITRTRDFIGYLLIGRTGHPECLGDIHPGPGRDFFFDIGDGDGIEDISFSDAVKISLTVFLHGGGNQSGFAFGPDNTIRGLPPCYLQVDIPGAECAQKKYDSKGDGRFSYHFGRTVPW